MAIKYEYGFLYPAYRWLIELLKKANAVEYFKKVIVHFGKKLGQNTESEIKRNKRIGTDLFIIFKH